jgi:isoleucyl-tRNA synthetase
MTVQNSSAKTFYPSVDANPDFPAIEQDVLARWKEHGTFSQTVENRPAKIDGANNEYIFYDGPPFANGLPHYGHLLTGYVKDLFARYHTMKGSRVERRFGWDCHGLPAEMGAEKELGVSGRANIEKFGIQKFNDYCRTSVMKYTGEWEDYVTRQARWVDFANDYKTMDTPYMESVMWAFSELYKKGLVYESHRVMPYSWAMETPVSNFETRMDNSYREREDKAITVAFKLKDIPAHLKQDIDFFKKAKGFDGQELNPDFAPEAVYVLAWTTTPWTLPSNLALAASDKVSYRAFYKEGALYIAESNWVYANAHKESQFLEYYDISGKAISTDGTPAAVYLDVDSLIGLEYEPLFPYFKDHPNSFRILDGSDFIEEGSGTGVVHMAPGFGEDDQRVCAKNDIELVVPVDERGCYTDAIFEHDGLALAGLNVVADTRKNADEPYTDKQLAQYGLANLRIITYLKGTGQLIKQENYLHNYPHCWRTDTPLIFRALPSWYVEVSKFAPRMVELNEQINWVPDHIKHGRFGKWLEGARDWSISRNRYWGSPIPVWKNDKDDEVKVFGSIAELQDFFGVEVNDLHRPFIDELVKEEGGKTWRRVTDVFDCWFESGSMPYAQVHYPFENKEWFETHFPADFIVEYEAQTRGWFYTLMVLSTALFDKPPFKNCICHGVVMSNEKDENGHFHKLSKRLKNYPDPMKVFGEYGADALRWFMMSSPVMRGAEMYIDKEGKFIRDSVRLYIKPIWNAYNFFTLYANADGVEATLDFTSQNVMDRYILSKLAEAVRGVELGLDSYDTPSACQAVTDFFEVLNNWYIRRNKERFWKKEKDADKQAAYNTLYTALHVMARAASPLLPLVTDTIYRGLTGKESVHLADFPSKECEGYATDGELMRYMDIARDVCNVALAIRNKNNIRVRQPLSTLELKPNPILVHGAKRPDIDAIWAVLSDVIKDEVNVEQVLSGTDPEEFKHLASITLQANLPVIGKTRPHIIKHVMGAAKRGEWERMADGNISIAGEVLEEGEYLIRVEPQEALKQSAQALSTNDAIVLLDLALTDELKQKGIARDVVRMIQQARKDADLDISAHIDLTLDLPEEFAQAVQAHESYIREQTLAASLRTGDAAQAPHRFENTLEEQKVVIAFSLSKAAA